MNDIVLAIIIFVAIILGWLLKGIDMHKIRNVQKRINHEVKEVARKVKPGKGEVMRFRRPTSEQEEAEKIARKKMNL